MKTRPIKTWIIFILAVFPAVLMAQSKNFDQLNVLLSSPGKPFKLNMNLAGGSVNISTHEGKDLRITALPAPATNDNTGMGKNQNVNINTNTNVNVNVNSGPVGINVNKGKLLRITENSNEVFISQLKQKQMLNIEVSLPRNNTSLNLSLSEKGNVNVDGITGEIVVNSANGPVTLKNISGSAMATTVNGNITATFKYVNGKAPMAFSTLIGNIDLSFPTSAKANFTIKSDQGIVSSDFNLAGDSKTKLIRNKNGWYQAKIAGSLIAKVNGGGQEITITNMQGDIYLHKRQ
ncbi:DUF4097 family beta strand repeat-containing protein [Pedobacter metabolipauper]|uniref:Putative adhesin n=1 Tax=Pedobacter metabolipauper TaxID=425513 RepID=A0A4V3D1N2_9SPHI|nr:DUF4097 family beta strand repeat-containing protein [Pedobacter metabolipauper]TDQ11743.1 putative adhesin [Pedobacter metabolipauper]